MRQRQAAAFWCKVMLLFSNNQIFWLKNVFFSIKKLQMRHFVFYMSHFFVVNRPVADSLPTTDKNGIPIERQR